MAEGATFGRPEVLVKEYLANGRHQGVGVPSFITNQENAGGAPASQSNGNLVRDRENL